MRFNLRYLFLVFAPLVLVTFLDLLVKNRVLAAMPSGEFLFFQITVVANKGIIGGYFSGTAKPLFQIPMITVGFFLLACLYFIQLFAPLRSNVMRVGISLFFGGVFANVLDRLLHGYVVDFLRLTAFGWTTPAFNIADIFQFVGMGLIFVWQFRPGTFDSHYGNRIWVSRQFQKRYSLSLVKLGFFVMLIFGVLSYTFVKVALSEMSVLEHISAKLLQDYLIFFFSTAITFLLFLFLIGKALSGYVVKPILNFEQYLRDLSQGNYHVFQISEPEFQYLEKLSDDVRDHIMELHQKIGRLEARVKGNRQ